MCGPHSSIKCVDDPTQNELLNITDFDQFVGGDTAEDCLPLLEELRAEGKGSLFAYSVEVDEAEAAGSAKERAEIASQTTRQIVQETLHCVDIAAGFEDKHAAKSGSVQGRKTWVALKLVSPFPGPIV